MWLKPVGIYICNQSAKADCNGWTLNMLAINYDIQKIIKAINSFDNYVIGIFVIMQNWKSEMPRKNTAGGD